MSPTPGWGKFWAKMLAGKGLQCQCVSVKLPDACSMNLHTPSGSIIVYKLKTFCFHLIVARECQRNRIRETLYSLGCLWEIRNDPSGPMRWRGRPRGTLVPEVFFRRKAASRKYLCFSGGFFPQNVRHPAVGDILVPFETFFKIRY